MRVRRSRKSGDEAGFREMRLSGVFCLSGLSFADDAMA